MSELKNIKALGLKLHTVSVNSRWGDSVVMASDLEALLEKGVRVYGPVRDFMAVGQTKTVHDTHTGLLIDYKPISKPKPVTKAELRSLLYAIENYHAMNLQDIPDLLKRALDAGVE